MEKRKLLVCAFVVRFVISYFILYYSKLGIVIKIGLVMLLDTIDCSRFHNKIFGMWEDCKKMWYQNWDKIIDTMIYFMLLDSILKSRDFSKTQKNVLKVFLVYRVIGVFLFLKSQNRKYLLLFPNFFLIYSLVFPIVNRYPIMRKNSDIIYILTALTKILQEVYLHY